MTSKEALEKMGFYVSEELNKDDFIECYETIEKDLEVLEILKSYMKQGEFDNIPYIRLEISPMNDNIEFNKVREWLENDI